MLLVGSNASCQKTYTVHQPARVFSKSGTTACRLRFNFKKMCLGFGLPRSILSKEKIGTWRRQVRFIRIQNHVLAMWLHGWYRLPQSNFLWDSRWVHYVEPSCCLTQCSEDIKAVVLLTEPLRLEERSRCASLAPEYSISHLCVHIYISIFMSIFMFIILIALVFVLIFVFILLTYIYR